MDIKTFTVTEDIFNVTIYGAYDCTNIEARDYFLEEHNVEIQEIEDADGFIGMRPDLPPTIYYWVSDCTEIDCVVHELFHCVARAFRMLKMPLCEDNEEMYAYYLQHLFREVTKQMEFPKDDK